MKKIYLLSLLLIIHCVFPDRKINLVHYKSNSINSIKNTKIFLEFIDERSPVSKAFFGSTYGPGEIVGHVFKQIFQKINRTINK